MKVAANLVREMTYAAAKYVATDDDFWRQQMAYLEGELATALDPLGIVGASQLIPHPVTGAPSERPTGAEVECARRLAVSLHDKHYPEVANWRPASDLVGLLTQIDNMTSNLTRRSEVAASIDSVAANLRRLSDEARQRFSGDYAEGYSYALLEVSTALANPGLRIKGDHNDEA